MEKINGIIIDGKVYEVIKGVCDKHCAFWNDELCDNILWYCTENYATSASRPNSPIN